MQPSLIFHIVRKDLRHVRFLFGLWLVLLLAQSLLIGSQSAFSPMGEAVSVKAELLHLGAMLVTLMIPLLQGLVISVLLPLLIHDEPLAGTTAFWITRPISGAGLLAAKSFFIATFLILPPLLINAGLLLANRITLAGTVAYLPGGAYESLSWIAPIAALAAITPSFGKYAFWFVVIFVCTAGIVYGLAIFQLFLLPDSVSAHAQEATLSISQQTASDIIRLGGSLFVIVCQFLTRRTGFCVVALATTLVGSQTAQMVWPIDFMAKPESTVQGQGFSADSFKISVASQTSCEPAATISRHAEPSFNISTTFGFPNVPPGYQVTIKALTPAEFLAPDGTRLVSLPSLEQTRPRWWESAISSAIGGVPVLNAPSPGKSPATILRLKAKDLEKWRNTAGAFEATAVLGVERLEEAGRLPLERGALLRAGPGTKEIEGVGILPETNSCTIVLRERKLNSTRDPREISDHLDEDYGGRYVLVNRARNEAILPEADSEKTRRLAGAMVQIGQPLINRPIALRFTGKSAGIALTSEWLAEAELAVLEAIPAGTLRRELTSPITLPDPRQ